ncbi:threonine/serine exporter family protein [Metabacillus litoralis]|uniref:Threonine/serine exporter family protein n=1 Tax=Metabacillus litoralis TaxID=152268 RepID=A0A5C6W159_9BACI|nr:threonine/serine exporter family protein [Metabacillus litoralis]TXC89505.1 threonine/serine exporter family protein [Metabacillus litoralis]
MVNYNENEIFDIMEVCLLAGKIMLRSGAETYRVEDTMMRIGSAYGVEQSHSYVTPTGIIFSVSSKTPTQLVRIEDRSTDLQKVEKVNSISREISNGELSVEEAYKQLKVIEQAAHAYPIWVQIAAASISSGCFLIMFNGGWSDFLPAVIAAGIGFSSLIYFHQLVEIKFFAEFLASFVIGLLAVLMVTLNIGTELDKIIIGSVMPLVPGLLITNAVRDLMAGHLVSGISKGAEAFLTAFAIGAGVAVVFSIY